MARVDLVEPWALRNARKAVRESLQAHGEEVIALRMYHPDPDETPNPGDGSKQPRCPNCYDDIYKQGDTFNCTVCYGTTYQGGIKIMARMWALIGTDNLDEKIEKRGVWQPFVHSFHSEAAPFLTENDYIVRVTRWSRDHKPLGVYGVYACKAIDAESLRTGHQLGQDQNDYVGQRGRISHLDTSHVLYRAYGREFSADFAVPRIDGRPR